jgi:hypothetical protein
MFSSSSSLVTENHQRTDVYFPGYFPCEGKYGIQSSQRNGKAQQIIIQSVLLVEKTTDLSQVIDKLYHIMLYTSP